MKIRKEIRIILLTALLILMISNSSIAVIRYVTPLGGDTLNGTSWSNAFPGSSLQLAITSSASGDEVWVSAGTYLTTNTLNRNISFSMRNGVTIYGSFSGTENNISQRVLSCGPTSILSGEIGVAGILDNSYHVISNINLNNTSVIDGFVIRGANDNRAVSFTNGLGGGIYNNGGNAGGICSPVIRNCVVTNNQAVFGGGIFNSGHTNGNSNPVILNCIITNNTALDGGGGIDNFGLGGNASPVITNCIIYNNFANTAGGMYCWGGNVNGNSNPVILNCAFINNQALAGNAGGLIADNFNSSGGGSSGTSNPVIRNSIFWGNTASGIGPQFFIKGTATFTATYSDIDMTNQNPPNIISGSGTGNLNINPLFFSISNPIGADNCWMTNDDGLQLQNTSPCINAGENSGVTLTDIRFKNRISNSIVDMGPYENVQNEITHFKAKQSANIILLGWKTTTILNLYKFTIEKSSDSIIWNQIGDIKSSGINFKNSSFSFTDSLPISGIQYYRIKIIKIDNSFSYSGTVSLNYVTGDIINKEHKFPPLRKKQGILKE